MSFILTRLLRSLALTGKRPTKSLDAVRIGILGTAKIAPVAIICPAKLSTDAIVVAIAARDGQRAEAYAKKHGIPKWYGSYEQLLEDPDIDAVYVPSPNGLHFRWAKKALECGKHVLCEKPLTSNADEGAELVAIAERCGKVLMEAAHSFHHPALIKTREIVRSGEIGTILEVKASFCIPYMPASDIRYNVNGTNPLLAGGAFMDGGVYTSHCVRFLTDLNFKRVLSARATEKFPGVDSSMEAVVEFENSEVIGRVRNSMSRFFNFSAEVIGTRGRVHLFNFLGPFIYHYITVTNLNADMTPRASRTVKDYGRDGRSTYEHQLAVFLDCIRRQPQGGLAKTSTGGTVDDPVGTMRMIDAIYEASGLGKRIGYEPLSS